MGWVKIFNCSGFNINKRGTKLLFNIVSQGNCAIITNQNSESQQSNLQR